MGIIIEKMRIEIREMRNKTEKGGIAMSKDYIYHRINHKLHIRGYCHYCNSAASPPFLFFDTENDVAKFAQQKYSMCKICSKKRDRILSDLSRNKKGEK